MKLVTRKCIVTTIVVGKLNMEAKTIEETHTITKGGKLSRRAAEKLASENGFVVLSVDMEMRDLYMPLDMYIETALTYMGTEDCDEEIKEEDE